MLNLSQKVVRRAYKAMEGTYQHVVVEKTRGLDHTEK